MDCERSEGSARCDTAKAAREGRTDPGSRVVSDETKVDGSTSGDRDGVPAHGVRGSLSVRRVELRVVRGDVESGSDHLVLVAVQMEGVCVGVPA